LGSQRFALADIGRIFRGQTVTGLSEWQLLERYLERQDELAFAALVERHGPMVLGVCRRMLASQADAEDAFQATFLVLVRRARQLGPRDAIGPWLYGVAARVALRARCAAARRRRFESTPIEEAALSWARQPGDFELAETLDQELSKLPSKYRSPIVLCYLEGQTHEEAARLLKWPVGTVKGRLARARDLLRYRLARRGLAPFALAVTGSLANDASACVPRELLESTVNSGMKCALGHTIAQVTSSSIASLVEGVLTAMLFTKIQSLGAALLISAVVLAGAGVMAQQHVRRLDAKLARSSTPAPNHAGTTETLGPPALASSPSDANRESPRAPAPIPGSTRSSSEPAVASPDPAGQLVQAANRAWNKVYGEYATGSGTVDRLHEVSALLMDAQKESAASPAETSRAIIDHLDRIRSIARLRHNIPYGATTKEGDNATLLAFAAKAELELAQPAGGRGGGGADLPKPKKTFAAPSARSHGKDPRSLLILNKLDDMLALKFPNETPLEEFLRYIKDGTKSSEMRNGIPIYVDPIGLQEAEKSINSTIQIDVEGVPLRRTLQLVLRQLGLAYLVEDGMIYITSQESFEQMPHLGPAIPEVSPIVEEGEKALRGEMTVDEMKEWLQKYKTSLVVKSALESECRTDEVSESGASTAALDQEIKKLAVANEELKKKCDKLESRLAEMRELLTKLVNSAKPDKETRKGKNLQ